ncbi:MAG TPA: hypothetical protein VFD92_03150 [Candidatus Binatia bacterium]|nr:hypothetical protein [Candidatus Binatia bacterium]
MNQLDPRLDPAWIGLKLAYGLVPLLAGLDKFFNLLADWPRYVSPAAAGLLPVAPQHFMYVVGVIEIVVGLAVLTRWTMVGSYVATVWLLCIAVNLVAAGYFDVAVRDVVMAVGAFTLARLTEVRGSDEISQLSSVRSAA